MRDAGLPGYFTDTHLVIGFIAKDTLSLVYAWPAGACPAVMPYQLMHETAGNLNRVRQGAAGCNIPASLQDNLSSASQ